MRAVEAWVAAHGRLPRARHQGLAAPAEERHLEAFLRVSRRSATREQMCSWQQDRLALIPAYDENPREDSWDRRFVAYLAFVTRFGRQPVKRSENRAERTLAFWAVTQRAAHRRGTLSSARSADLERIPGWMWNPPGRVPR